MEAHDRVARRRFEVAVERLEKEQSEKFDAMRKKYDLQVERIQNEYKFWAVLLPPIPPLLVGIIVYFRRRLLEREGVSKNRLV
jgi:ABC-2 type transport system permease protein